MSLSGRLAGRGPSQKLLLTALVAGLCIWSEDDRSAAGGSEEIANHGNQQGIHDNQSSKLLGTTSHKMLYPPTSAEKRRAKQRGTNEHLDAETGTETSLIRAPGLPLITIDLYHSESRPVVYGLC